MTIKTNFDGNININQTSITSIDIGYVLDTFDTLDTDYTFDTLDIYYFHHTLTHLNTVAITILVILM